MACADVGAIVQVISNSLKVGEPLFPGSPPKLHLDWALSLDVSVPLKFTQLGGKDPGQSAGNVFVGLAFLLYMGGSPGACWDSEYLNGRTELSTMEFLVKQVTPYNPMSSLPANLAS